jgi:hypothetical protein
VDLERHPRVREALAGAIGLACLATLLVTTGCLFREVEFDDRKWVESETRESPLSLTRAHDADGRLASVRLEGTIHVYKSWLDGVVSKPLEPLRDLTLKVDLRMDRDLARTRSDPWVDLRFYKVSPLFYGPRVVSEDRLEITLDGSRYSHEIKTESARNGSHFFVIADVRVPLTTFLGLGTATESRVRLASLSPFSLKASQRQVLRQLDVDLRTLGTQLRKPLATEAPDRTRDQLHPYGYIKGFRYTPESAMNRSRVVLITSYPGPNLTPSRLTPTSWIEYPASAPSTPLVARMCKNEGTVIPVVPDEDVADSRRAFELATVVTDELRETFGLDLTPETYAIVYPLDDYQGCVLSLVRPLGRGIAIGIPSFDGRILDSHASVFVWILTHEYAEGLLMIPELGAGCSLYGRDRRNRWLGDGIAELVASRAQLRARSRGLDLPPSTQDIRQLVNALQHGHESVNLSRWLTIQTRTPFTGRDKSEAHTSREGTPDERRPRPGPATTFLRYLAAEYLVAEWRRQAMRPDAADPLREFVKWLSEQKGGPTYEEVVGWMSETSGLDIAKIAQNVALRDVLRYHVDKWRQLGRRVPRRVNRFLESSSP